ncbi:unnamed protein product [Lepidochelys olivacea]
MESHISQISADVASKLQNNLKNSLAFSLVVEKSRDIQDKPQLAIFVRYVSVDVILKEEMLNSVALKETTCSIHVKNALDKAFTHADIQLDKLVSIAMDGAPVMVGKKSRPDHILEKQSQISGVFPCLLHHPS